MVQRNSATPTAIGAALLALGMVLFAVRSGLFVLTFSAGKIETWADIVATLPTLAIGLLRAGTDVVFSQHAYFTVLSRVLVSFWPALLMAAGAALVIRSQAARKQRAAAGI